MELQNTEATFRRFAKQVQKKTRFRISRGKHRASGNLRKNTSFNVKVSKNSIELQYKRPAYSDYQDRGVSGTEVKHDTPFSYKSKRPPSKVFEKWAKQKGIKPRNKETGRFITFKSFGFLVARKIFTKGIEPKQFFTKSFKEEFQKLPNPLKEAFGKDVINLYKSALK